MQLSTQLNEKEKNTPLLAPTQNPILNPTKKKKVEKKNPFQE
jgi:hypothetical protein